MQLATELREVTTSGVLQTARAQVKATAKVFSFFSDNIYANKEVAITRELVSNGVDSHVMAGKANVPVEVWLPTEFDPTFKVRDKGLGMSPEFMMNNFMMYSDASTKDGNNIAIGGFGIGSKSPFAYVDAYTIRSVFNFVATVYSVFKDDEGIPSIAMLAQETTDECNGVEVSFPVKQGDAQKFEEAAYSTLNYFDPLPIIRNATSGQFKLPEYTARGDSWGMRMQAGDFNVIMGGVMYKGSVSSLPWTVRSDEEMQNLLNYGIDLKMPIGSCDIALSREALSYTDRTIAAIKQALLDVKDEIVASFSTMFDQFDTLWEARAALGREVGIGNQRYGFNTRGKFLGQNAKYRGNPLDPYLEMGNVRAWEIEPRRSRRSATSLSTAKWEDYTEHSVRFAPTNTDLIIVDDLPLTPKSKTGPKIRQYVHTNCTREGSIYVVRLDEGYTLAELLDELGNPPYIETSTMPEPVPATRTAAVRPHVRLFTYSGKRDNIRNEYFTNLNPGQWASSYKGVAEIAYADQPATGILVQMTNYSFDQQVTRWVDSGLIAWNELHFANTADIPKLTAWRTVEEVFAERLEAKLAAFPGLAERISIYQHPALQTHFRYLKNAKIHTLLNNRQKRTKFGKICGLYETYVEPMTQDELKLSHLVTPTLPVGVNPDKLVEGLSDSLTDIINLTTYQHTWAEKYKHLVLEFI